MTNIDIKFHIEAEYRNTLAAISELGKALERVQQKAKLVLPGAGGQQVQDTAEQQKNMQALAQAVATAAKAAEMLSAAMERLSPALREMGPEAQQVEQVAALGQHYGQLAQALSVAAEAAARYKAADGGMKETDERINKLMAENAALMDRLSAVQAEYMAMVQGNAERERERVLREESAQAAEKEKQVTTDETYQMELARMSKRQLVEEIQRLAQARKAAAAAGNEYDYNVYSEQLKMARQELRKMNQEQQVNKIAFLQQAQVAQQMGANLRTLTDGVMNFSENLENGTLNLTGMASAVLSLSMAIKAGLGPLGWALAAVEALTLAWNWFAKRQQEAKKAEEEQKKKVQDLATAFNEAAEAVNAFVEKEAELGKLEDLKRAYAGLNEELRERNKLLDDSLRKLEAELAMRAKEEDFERTLKRNEIMREFWSGRIDEEERDRRLDELNVTSAEQKRKRTMEKEQAELDAAQAREKGALDRLGAATGLRERLQMEKNGMFSPEEIKMLSLEDKNLSYLMEEVKKFEALGTETGTYFANERRDTLDELFNKKFGISYRSFESGRYKEQYDSLIERLKTATAEAEAAQTAYNEAKADVLAKQGDVALSDAQSQQDVRIAQRTAQENVVQRKAEADYKAAQQQKKEAERLREQAEAEALREAKRKKRERNRFNRLGSAARVEGKAEGNVLKGDVLGFSKNAYSFLRDGALDKQEADVVLSAMREARKKGNESLMKLVDELVGMARDMGQTSETVLAEIQKERNRNDKKTKSMVD